MSMTPKPQANKTISEILADFGGLILGDQMTTTKRIDYATNAITQAMLDALPKKIDNKLIELNLQNGKPQQAASYNGFNAAIVQMETAIKKIGGMES